MTEISRDRKGWRSTAAKSVVLMTAIRLKWWEITTLVPFALLSPLFFVGGQVVAGVVLAALLGVAVASRAEIRERNRPGGFARTRAVLLLAEWASLLAIYVVAVWLFFVIHSEHWTRDRHGAVAF